MNMARRLDAMGIEKYRGLTKLAKGRPVWTGKVREDAAALMIPLRWRKPRKIFVNSMSDLFHDDVSDAFIASVWDVMRETPHHNYQILTKRPERMDLVLTKHIREVLPNVWIGTSVESSKVVDRIAHLQRVPAAIRFISFEPLIGPVGKIDLSGIHWAIVGGESGREARPIKEEWIDEIHELCAEHDVAFFFKQWGGVQKHRTGRALLGQTFDEMPRVAAPYEQAS